MKPKLRVTGCELRIGELSPILPRNTQPVTRNAINTPGFISTPCKLIVQTSNLKEGGRRHESTI